MYLVGHVMGPGSPVVEPHELIDDGKSEHPPIFLEVKYDLVHLYLSLVQYDVDQYFKSLIIP